MIPDHWVTDPYGFVAAVLLGAAMMALIYEVGIDLSRARKRKNWRRKLKARYWKADRPEP
jgi:hypothetical protein